MDGDIFPNVIDYWGPTGMVFVRNPQLRWTFVNNGGWEAAVALEHPSDDIDPGRIRLIDEDVASNIQSNEELPDLTAPSATAAIGAMFALPGSCARSASKLAARKATSLRGMSSDGASTQRQQSSLAFHAPVRCRLWARHCHLHERRWHGSRTGRRRSRSDPEGGFLVVPRAVAVKLLGISAYADIQWSKQ